jgi:MFS family permease
VTDAAAPRRFSTAQLLLLVLVPFGAAYFLSYLYRTINSVVGKIIVGELKLGAGDIGLLTAAYFLVFALFQVPLGVLLDRFGPRRVHGTLMIVAALGALAFSFGETRDELLLARATIGLGVSAGLMAAFKAITLWFPKERWALVNGLLLTFGGLGAVAGTAPVEWALGLVDWRGVFQGLAVATLASAGLLFAVVPEQQAAAPPASLGEQARSLGRVYRHPLFWALAPLCVFTQSCNLALQGLWAGLWLRDVGGFDASRAAEILALLNVGMTAGFLGTAVLADRAASRRLGLAGAMTIFSLLFFAAQLSIVLALAPRSPWPWILFGFFANAAIFAYPLLSARLPVAFSGRANTALNFVSFSGAFLGQFAVGWIIDLFPRVAGGFYPPEAYRLAFAILLGLEIAGLAWFLYAYRRFRAAEE